MNYALIQQAALHGQLLHPRGALGSTKMQQLAWLRLQFVWCEIAICNMQKCPLCTVPSCMLLISKNCLQHEPEPPLFEGKWKGSHALPLKMILSVLTGVIY